MATVVLQWHGLACVALTQKHDVGDVTVITDPFGPEDGIKLPRSIAADIVVLSVPLVKHRPADLVGGQPFVIDHAGEYESKGVSIFGMRVPPAEDGQRGAAAAKQPCTVYRFEMDDLTIVHLGYINRPLTDSESEQFADADVLLLPVGGQGHALDPRDAAAVVTSLEPRVVVPILFQLPGLSRTLDPVERFIKEVGLKPETVEKLKLTKKDLPQEETKLYRLLP